MLVNVYTMSMYYSYIVNYGVIIMSVKNRHNFVTMPLQSVDISTSSIFYRHYSIVNYRHCSKTVTTPGTTGRYYNDTLATLKHQCSGIITVIRYVSTLYWHCNLKFKNFVFGYPFENFFFVLGSRIISKSMKW